MAPFLRTRTLSDAGSLDQSEKVLKKACLEGADWEEPASVNVLFVASTQFWPRTVSDSDADSMPLALPLHLMIVTKFLLPL